MITMRIRKTLHSALLLATLATFGGYGLTGERAHLDTTTIMGGVNWFLIREDNC
jgi:hypothetical protein